MAGYRDRVRQRRNQMRAARGAEPLPEPEARRGRNGPDDPNAPPPAWDETPAAQSEAVDNAQAQAAMHEREEELAEAKRLIGELKDYAEQLESRVGELVAGAAPLVATLLLPGVKTFLLTKFHPDKYPEASDEQRAKLTEATKTITAAYARADALQASD
jgi:hypothetical protein